MQSFDFFVILYTLPKKVSFATLVMWHALQCMCCQCNRMSTTVLTSNHANCLCLITFSRAKTSGEFTHIHHGYIHSFEYRNLALQWRHNGRDSVSNHQPRECLLSRLIRQRSKKTSKLRVTGLCAGNSPKTGEFPAQKASNAENVSIWWHHHQWRQY